MATAHRMKFSAKLKEFVHPDNVHFQPPATVKLKYPCIIYNRMPAHKNFANNQKFLNKPLWRVQVIDKNPDSTIGDDIDNSFMYSKIISLDTIDNLLHTTIEIYY